MKYTMLGPVVELGRLLDCRIGGGGGGGVEGTEDENGTVSAMPAHRGLRHLLLRRSASCEARAAARVVFGWYSSGSGRRWRFASCFEQRGTVANSVSHPSLLRLEVPNGLRMGGLEHRTVPRPDLDTETAEFTDFVRVVGDETHRLHTQVGEQGGHTTVVAVLLRQAQEGVGIDCVAPETLLQLVRRQFVCQPDAPPLLGHVQQHTHPSIPEQPQGRVQLLGAVAFPRAEHLARLTLIMHPQRHCLPPCHVPEHHRHNVTHHRVVVPAHVHRALLRRQRTHHPHARHFAGCGRLPGTRQGFRDNARAQALDGLVNALSLITACPTTAAPRIPQPLDRVLAPGGVLD
eukprot:Hpha_TRINITY_DN12999_c0_g2::TRINITY_DN12999_c0_g2_i1::g.164335::m.164335